MDNVKKDLEEIKKIVTHIRELVESDNRTSRRENTREINKILRILQRVESIDQETINEIEVLDTKVIKGGAEQEIEALIEKLLEVSSSVAEEAKEELRAVETMELIERQARKLEKSGKTPLILENLDKVGENIKEITIDDANEISLKSCESFGADYELEKLIWDPERRIAVVDDHNLVLPYWNAAYNSGMKGRTLLFHVDGHRDMKSPDNDDLAMPSNPFKTIEKVDEYTSEVGIEQFIKVGYQQGIIDEVQLRGHFPTGENVDITEDLIQKSSSQFDRIIFDLDIDLFADSNLAHHESRPNIADEEVMRELRRLYMELCADLMLAADITTVALSPGYIDQQKARELLTEIIEIRDQKTKEGIIKGKINSLLRYLS